MASRLILSLAVATDANAKQRLVLDAPFLSLSPVYLLFCYDCLQRLPARTK